MDIGVTIVQLSPTFLTIAVLQTRNQGSRCVTVYKLVAHKGLNGVAFEKIWGLQRLLRGSHVV